MGSPKVLDGYPQAWGNKRISVFYHAGPASYVQMVVATPVITGDPVTDVEGGGRYIEFLDGGVSDDGQFRVECVPGGGNPSQAAPQSGTVGAAQKTWRLRWIVCATNAEVAAAVNLSGRTVRLLAVLNK